MADSILQMLGIRPMDSNLLRDRNVPLDQPMPYDPSYQVPNSPPAQRVGDVAGGALSALPSVGDAYSVLQAIADLEAGNYGDAVWNGVAALPMVVGLGSTKAIAHGAKPTEFELAHQTAQKNAALPAEKGGLGLPADNTAMDRAKAMGFDTPAYHATTKDISEFDRNLSSPAAAFGPGVYTEYDKSRVSGWAKDSAGANVMPLLVNKDSVLRAEPMDNNIADQISQYLGRDVVPGDPPPYLSLERRGGSVSEGASLAGFSGVDHFGPGAHGLNTVFYDPTKLRSRFAAFDPMNRNSANILAGSLLGSLGLQFLEGGGYEDRLP